MERRSFIRLTLSILGTSAVVPLLQACGGSTPTPVDSPDLATSQGPSPDLSEPGSPPDQASAKDLAQGPADLASSPPDQATSPADMASGQACATGASATSISGHAGHALLVPAAHFVSATERSYSIQGSSGHDHSVTLTAASFAMLAAGQSVIVTSTSGGGHTHQVTVACA